MSTVYGLFERYEVFGWREKFGEGSVWGGESTMWYEEKRDFFGRGFRFAQNPRRFLVDFREMRICIRNPRCFLEGGKLTSLGRFPAGVDSKLRVFEGDELRHLATREREVVEWCMSFTQIMSV